MVLLRLYRSSSAPVRPLGRTSVDRREGLRACPSEASPRSANQDRNEARRAAIETRLIQTKVMSQEDGS